jgi:hypothetical protein
VSYFLFTLPESSPLPIIDIAIEAHFQGQEITVAFLNKAIKRSALSENNGEADTGFKSRLAIAISVSIVVNAIIFGTAGIIGHRFLQSLQLMIDQPRKVTIQRVYIRDLPGGGTVIEREPMGGASHHR